MDQNLFWYFENWDAYPSTSNLKVFTRGEGFDPEPFVIMASTTLIMTMTMIMDTDNNDDHEDHHTSFIYRHKM